MVHVTESTRVSGRLRPGYQHPSAFRWGAGFVATTPLLELCLCWGCSGLCWLVPGWRLNQQTHSWVLHYYSLRFIFCLNRQGPLLSFHLLLYCGEWNEVTMKRDPSLFISLTLSHCSYLFPFVTLSFPSLSSNFLVLNPLIKLPPLTFQLNTLS